MFTQCIIITIIIILILAAIASTGYECTQLSYPSVWKGKA